MANFIDRRLNAKGKSTVNRQRFINRYKQQIKKAVSDAVTRRSVTDVDKGEKISIPTRDISEPMFHQGKGGVRDRVHPGMTNSPVAIKLTDHREVLAAERVKVMPPIQVKVMMTLHLKSQRMNTLNCYLKI